MTDDADPGAAPILVTGAAGFIGFHVATRLLDAGRSVVGVDNLSPYYDVALKEGRLALLQAKPGFSFHRADLADRDALGAAFDAARPRVVINLAAQAGVRYSLENPEAYAESNLVGFLNVLEACRRREIRHLVYASSSSVYGGNAKLPFSAGDPVDHPVSLYAATKKANELMAHSYAHLYGLPATGLRFFTVYGDWGRPDMAYWRFTEAILENRPIQLYNHGRMARDFTHIDDVADAILRLVDAPPEPDPGFDRTRPHPATSWAPHRVFNVGNTRREPLSAMVSILEEAIGRTAEAELLPMQPGDVTETWADVSGLDAAIGYAPKVTLAEGLPRFVTWYRGWRGL